MSYCLDIVAAVKADFPPEEPPVLVIPSTPEEIYLVERLRIETALKKAKRRVKDNGDINNLSLELIRLKAAEEERLKKINTEKLLKESIEKKRIREQENEDKKFSDFDKNFIAVKKRKLVNLGVIKEEQCIDVVDIANITENLLSETQKEYTEEDYQKWKDSIKYNIVGLHQAKESLELILTLRAQTEQPQRLLCLEGKPGVGKTKLVEEIMKDFMLRYPGRFDYRVISVPDVTAHVMTTSEKIMNLWEKLKKIQAKGMTIVLFVDEAEEIYSSRIEDGGDIKRERTFAMIRMLNLMMPNLLIILATNRPNMIDKTVLERCGNSIFCPLPTKDELRLIIKMHMPFLDEIQRNIILRFIIESKYDFNGRDIFNLAANYKELIDLKNLKKIDPVLSSFEIAKYFQYMENSKKNSKADYLKDGSKE